MSEEAVLAWMQDTFHIEVIEELLVKNGICSREWIRKEVQKKTEKAREEYRRNKTSPVNKFKIDKEALEIARKYATKKEKEGNKNEEDKID